MPTYNSVEEYFKAFQPTLVEVLDNTGGFWPEVKNNTISNAELGNAIRVGMYMGRPSSATYRAAILLMVARMLGELPNPG